MNLLWLDLETTGLEPADCEILEVAFALVTLDKPFDPLLSYEWVLQFPRERHSELSPFIRDMHGKNGLLEACVSANTLNAGDVEHAVMALLRAAGGGEIDRKDPPVLAGSSVHFDHAFLREHMPVLAKSVSHRHYDVSAVKLFCQSLGMPKLPKAEAHRAAADIRESIAHAEKCRDWLYSP